MQVKNNKKLNNRPKQFSITSNVHIPTNMITKHEEHFVIIINIIIIIGSETSDKEE